MACGSSWASSASGCTAGVALFHLFPVFLLGPACWLRHGVLVANAEIQGNKREYSASLKLGFRWHAVTPAHPPVTQQSSNVAWSNVKMLRSTVGRWGGYDKSVAAGSIETNDVIQRWPWFPPSDGLCHSALSLGQSLDTPSDLCLCTATIMCCSCSTEICLLSQFAWMFSFLLDFYKAGTLTPSSQSPVSSHPTIICILLSSPQLSL